MSGLRDGELETAQEMSVSLRAGEIRSAELVERALSRAEAWQPHTNAFSQLWPEEALRQARRTDEGLEEERGTLAGVPIAVKDLFDVAGHETTGCCQAYAGTVADRDAPTVARLKDAGLILIGKTNQHEIAAGSTNLVSSYGRTGNPWNPRCMTGGSSGGSGAAVAAGVVPWTLGSDTGGSIRIPASLCGTFGLKPTTGSISIEGLLPHSPSLDCPGPIASDADDLALLHGILTGSTPDARHGDLSSFPMVAPSGGYFEEASTPSVIRARDRLIEEIRAAGGNIVTVDGRGLEDARRIWAQVAYPELYGAHPLLRDRRQLVSSPILELLDYGERLDEAARAEGVRRRAEIGRWFEERLRGATAMLVPTTPYPAPEAEAYAAMPWPSDVPLAERMNPAWLTCPINLAGLPAITLPAAFSEDGLPMGMSLVGRAGTEATLLALAARWQRVARYRATRPQLPPPPAPGRPGE